MTETIPGGIAVTSITRAEWPSALRRAVVGVAAAFVFAVPFLAYARMVLVHFYVRGAVLYDAGLFAYAMWHSDLRLSLPPSVGERSFFADHFFALLPVLSAVSSFLPLSMPQFFAAFIGASHGLIALAILWLLVEGYGLHRPASLVFSVALSLGFAFSGLAVAVSLYPHVESFEAASLMMFLVALVLGRLRAASAWFVLALVTREDAGLHAAILLLVVLAAHHLRGTAWPRRRAALAFAAAGIGYAAAAFAAQHVFWPSARLFVAVYLGNPPFSHIDARLIGLRIAFVLRYRAYLLLPALVAAVWSERAHTPAPVLGLAACAPWLLLHLCANTPLAGAMAGYYAFPFLLAFAWPLAGMLVETGGPPQPAARTATLRWFAGLVAVGWIPVGGAYNPGRIPLPGAFLAAPSRSWQAATENAVAALVAARPLLGRLVVDSSIVALRPAAFRRSEMPGWQAGPPDTVALFAEGFDSEALRDLAAQEGLTQAYAAPGTSLLLLSRRALDDVPALRGVYRAEPGALIRPNASSTSSVATPSSTVSAAPSNTAPRSVSPKMPTGSVTQPGG